MDNSAAPSMWSRFASMLWRTQQEESLDDEENEEVPDGTFTASESRRSSDEEDAEKPVTNGSTALHSSHLQHAEGVELYPKSLGGGTQFNVSQPYSLEHNDDNLVIYSEVFSWPLLLRWASTFTHSVVMMPQGK